MMIKISVIVPIYNTEKYLCECIESIINQSFRNIEVILVNDGSTDSSLLICNKYAQNDKRIQVISKDNEGSVSARKAGVKVATGDYITFVDSDDYLELDTLEKLYKCAEKDYPDVVVCAFMQDFGTSVVYMKNRLSNGFYQGEELSSLYDKIMNQGNFYTFSIWPSLWTKLCKREILIEYHMKIPNDITMGDDAGVTFPILFNCKSIVIDNSISGYHYRVVEGSLTRKNDNVLKYFEQISNLYVYLKEEFSKKMNPDIDAQLQAYRLYLIDGGMNRLKKSSHTIKERMNCIENIIKDTDIFKDIEKSDLSNYPNKIYIKLIMHGKFADYVLIDLIEMLRIVKSIPRGVFRRLKYFIKKADVNKYKLMCGRSV